MRRGIATGRGLRFRAFAAAGHLLAVCAIGWDLADSHPSEVHAFSIEMPGLPLRFGEEITPYGVTGIFVLPGEEIPIELIGADPDSDFHLVGTAGEVRRAGRFQWVWRAPEKSGLYEGLLADEKNETVRTLNLFVMVPFDRMTGEYLNGYRIGKYPSFADNPAPSLGNPRGFIEVTKENVNARLSPHFRLGQFVCKQEGGYPKYVLLKERLILKLERILEKANERGIPCSTFTVMSGYRTPFYNRFLGNRKDSMHLWGAAADFFVDENPKDGIMDDLNRDGRIDSKDAEVLYAIIDGMYGESEYEPFVGGLAWYRATEWHGPFVHTDVRGYMARWGIP